MFTDEEIESMTLSQIKFRGLTVLIGDLRDNILQALLDGSSNPEELRRTLDNVTQDLEAMILSCLDPSGKAA